MKSHSSKQLLDNFIKINDAAQKTFDTERCLISPSPELKKKLDAEMKKLKSSNKGLFSDRIGILPENKIGFNDGLIYPGTVFPAGTNAEIARSAAANRALLSGTVKVAVILVDFSDKPMTTPKSHFENLFFSLGSVATGSVREYYREVTHGIVDIQGQVVGPYRMPKTLSQYANGNSGTGGASPNARTMAKDAAVAANPALNYALFDNDHDGYVDAFIVIHAGSGAEVTGSTSDIWSHKWVLEGGTPYAADGTKIYSYLTVPEDCRLGVCAHELGHLLFGFPDLYDTDYSSEGIGNWCLMSGGSWNNGGNTPAHPSAWCKCQQNWVTTITPTTNQSNVAFEDVKTGYKVHKLWKNGAPANEYFLVENRQKVLFDKFLPNSGLLIWHIDDSTANNTNENHYKVALMQADGKREMELDINRGDVGDSFPGSTNNTKFNYSTNPSSKSYAGSNTCVAVNNISASANIMHADLQVKCIVKIKEVKEIKEIKELKLEKVELKELKVDKSIISEKGLIRDKQIVEKRVDKLNEKLADGGFNNLVQDPNVCGEVQTDLTVEQRLLMLETQLAYLQPFIGQALRPDLSEGALQSETDQEPIEE